MADPITLVKTIERVLVNHGFAIESGLRIAGTGFDLVAENETKVVFIEVKSSNCSLLDDFHDQQASLATVLSEVELGQKWRDVYLVELTTDPIDSVSELEMSETIQANTSTARKFVLDASNVDPLNETAVEELLGLLISELPITGSPRDINVLKLLEDRLVEDGFSQSMVERLIENYSQDKHDCSDLILQELNHEA